MNLYNLIDKITDRILQEEGLPNLMARNQNFNFDMLTEVDKEQIKLNLMNYLIFCFNSLFQILQIPSTKFKEKLKKEDIIDFALIAGVFLSLYPEAGNSSINILPNQDLSNIPLQ